ncbi:hypothetical protein CLAFUW4_12810 [Fulvia fulva]|uniref:Uncharacterized protein n=1 Tax=Passalora fulva TaxID=5499 RepID=A0A9Q8PJ14_PASFU|nr:uncharacterized protein CLAFUR5_12678 [Fulvia fulva]KAK4611486.1 hypothetical protein CLAFUR4_12814 [Fulvia fulva]KAK4612443.1 hypothetical protein CLAFUR0_12820 [Fulvia fulva]UJO23326.1 hypothetical protein CLAFUR5_12678 [Fulvia fulva]WPV20844.1 hypothetical protein CLAFUW4_12810 [Fulvia fulva]WPV36430.1 hypothetical protein CLAFUW7_12818 [Fulvia fulva]
MAKTWLLPSRSSPPPQRARITLNNLPDELLCMIFAFNVSKIFDLQDLRQYLAGARANSATSRCAIEVLCRHFNVQWDNKDRISHKFSEAEVWAGSYRGRDRPTAKDLATRDGGQFLRPWTYLSGPGIRTLVAAQGKKVLWGQSVQMLRVSPSLADTVVISLFLRARSAGDLHAVLSQVELIARGLPQLRTVTLNFELKDPEWMQQGFVARHLDDFVSLLGDRGCAVRVVRLPAFIVPVPLVYRLQNLLLPSPDDSERTVGCKCVVLILVWLGICAALACIMAVWLSGG